MRFIDELKARALRFERHAVNTAVHAPPAKIAHEEMILVARGKTGAGIVREARRAITDVGDGRLHPSGLFGVFQRPEFFGIPHASGRRFAELVGGAPTGIPAFGHIDDAGSVAVVAIVIAGEEVAVIIERERLWIAQAIGVNFHIRAVLVATQGATGFGIGKHLAFEVGDV